MSIHYRVAIDRDNDGRFAAVINQDVLELRWRLGLRRAYESMADYSWARITLHNPHGVFSPERHSLPSGMRVRIQSDANGAVRSHFTGVISYIEPDAGTLGRKQAVIHLQDIQPWLEDSPARIAPQIDVTADQVIRDLLDQAVIRRAVIAGFCLIDVGGYNMIDRARIFPPQHLTLSLERGKTRFAYVGDWWRDSTSIRQAISEIVASERGRFYVDREGALVFLNRHYTLLNETLAAQFDDNMSGMSYSYGDQRLNRLTVLMRPREIGERDTLLWQLQGELRLEQRSELPLTLRLVDEQYQPFGLLAFDRLVSRFQRAPENRGYTINEDVAVEITRLGMTSVELRLVNRRREAVYLTLLQLYGKPLYRHDPLEIVEADGEGQYVYGLKQLSLDLPALSDVVTARAFAAYEVLRRKHPRGLIHSLRLDAREHGSTALNAALFDRIRVSESQTGHQARDYFIIGEEHHIRDGGARHEVEWTLEPADSNRFVIVDDSLIGDRDEVLAPY